MSLSKGVIWDNEWWSGKSQLKYYVRFRWHHIESHALVHNLEVCMDSWVIVLTRGANSLGGIDISIS